jgi:subtilisin family serine protease
MSLSSAKSDSINKMVNDATAAGIHVVASAGDLGQDACNFSPASALQAIIVGATEKTSNNVASFSNTGSCVTLYAPGRDIIAAGAGQSNALSQASGTSQSCPHAAGAVALIISKSGNKSPSSMKSSLVSLATKGILNKEPNVFLRVPTP